MKHTCSTAARTLAISCLLAAHASSTPGQASREDIERNSAFLDHLSITARSGEDGLRHDSDFDVLVRYRNGVVREIRIPLVGDDARHAELHYNDLAEPPVFEEGPVAAIDALGVRFRQGGGGLSRDNFTMTFLSITLTGESRSFLWTVSVTSSVAHRFRGDEDYFPGGLSVSTRPNLCAEDADCDDRLFCTGIEHCLPAHPAADFRGCVQIPRLCDQKELCFETLDGCLPASCQTLDRDGDGRVAVECGGDDCDDGDGGRYPGNAEVCDGDHHDEDCDPTTFGQRDRDGDGHIDNLCCNTSFDGNTAQCGTDCDDLNPQIVPGAQICGSQGTVLVCNPSGKLETTTCLEGHSCSAQPNGLGICSPDNPCACEPFP